MKLFSNMKTRFLAVLTLPVFIPLLLVLLLLIMSAVPLRQAQASTTNYSTAIPGVLVIPIQISGQYTATTTPVKFVMPFKCKLIGISANARASGGTSPTLTVDLKNGSTSLLSSAISLTAGTVSEGTISTSTIADESTMSIVLTIGGSSPTWDDITVLLTVVRI